MRNEQLERFMSLRWSEKSRRLIGSINIRSLRDWGDLSEALSEKRELATVLRLMWLSRTLRARLRDRGGAAKPVCETDLAELRVTEGNK
jgi:hypothetical protein